VQEIRGELASLVEIQRPGDEPIMGVLDLNVGSITVNMLALVPLLLRELDKVANLSAINANVAISLSVVVFVLSLINTIKPRQGELVKLSMDDATVYTVLLEMKAKAGEEEMVGQADLAARMAREHPTIEIEKSLAQLKKKRLIVQAKSGIFVTNRVEVAIA
jgi:hypothetical protein